VASSIEYVGWGAAPWSEGPWGRDYLSVLVDGDGATGQLGNSIGVRCGCERLTLGRGSGCVRIDWQPLQGQLMPALLRLQCIGGQRLDRANSVAQKLRGRRNGIGCRVSKSPRAGRGWSPIGVRVIVAACWRGRRSGQARQRSPCSIPATVPVCGRLRLPGAVGIGARLGGWWMTTKTPNWQNIVELSGVWTTIAPALPSDWTPVDDAHAGAVVAAVNVHPIPRNGSRQSA
jgi:hypothetical protein